MASVTFDHVTKRFGEVIAVNDLCLEIDDQEFLVLLGPSGCGKTTALRMVAGLERPSSGEILIEGRAVTNVEPKDRDIAMVFQNYALYPHMKVFDNMAFGLKMRGRPQEEIRQKVQQAAESLGLTELLERKVQQLSGGQRQRVALGRAIVRDPRVFLMDEPLSNLDAKLRTQTRTELIRLHHRLQATVLYVTHDQIEAMSMATRIAILNQGILQQIDVPQAIYDTPANLFVAAFIGNPPMNLLPVTLRREGETLVASANGVSAPLTPLHAALAATAGSQGVTLGVRPEHIRLIDANNADAGTVEVVEPLGSETLVTVRQGEFEVVARIVGASPHRVGDPVHLDFASEHLHLFDRQSGINLAARQPAAVR